MSEPSGVDQLRAGTARLRNMAEGEPGARGDVLRATADFGSALALWLAEPATYDPTSNLHVDIRAGVGDEEGRVVFTLRLTTPDGVQTTMRMPLRLSAARELGQSLCAFGGAPPTFAHDVRQRDIGRDVAALCEASFDAVTDWRPSAPDEERLRLAQTLVGGQHVVICKDEYALLVARASCDPTRFDGGDLGAAMRDELGQA